MARSLFLLTISCIITTICGPIALSAADMVTLSGLNPEGIVETVPLPEPEPEPEPAPSYQALTTITYTEPAVQPVYVPRVQNYTVNIPIGTVSEYNSTAFSLGSSIYKFRKMIYGHNSAGVLGSLAYRYPGEMITITENGVTSNYQVATMVTYQKTADGNLNGDPSIMANIANTAMGYDVALLTCAGTPYGNGDASHRLVVYANRV